MQTWQIVCRPLLRKWLDAGVHGRLAGSQLAYQPVYTTRLFRARAVAAARAYAEGIRARACWQSAPVMSSGEERSKSAVSPRCHSDQIRRSRRRLGLPAFDVTITRRLLAATRTSLSPSSRLRRQIDRAPHVSEAHC